MLVFNPCHNSLSFCPHNPGAYRAGYKEEGHDMEDTTTLTPTRTDLATIKTLLAQLETNQTSPYMLLTADIISFMPDLVREIEALRAAGLHPEGPIDPAPRPVPTAQGIEDFTIADLLAVVRVRLNGVLKRHYSNLPDIVPPEEEYDWNRELRFVTEFNNLCHNFSVFAVRKGWSK